MCPHTCTQKCELTKFDPDFFIYRLLHAYSMQCSRTLKGQNQKSRLSHSPRSKTTTKRIENVTGWQEPYLLLPTSFGLERRLRGNLQGGSTQRGGWREGQLKLKPNMGWNCKKKETQKEQRHAKHAPVIGGKKEYQRKLLAR